MLYDVTIAYPVYRWRRIEVEAPDPATAARAALAEDEDDDGCSDWDETEGSGPTFVEFISPALGAEIVDYPVPEDCTEAGRNTPGEPHNHEHAPCDACGCPMCPDHPTDPRSHDDGCPVAE